MVSSRMTSAANPDGLLDSRYYDASGPGTLAERVVVQARDRIYAQFLEICRPGPDDLILDVGVSDVVSDSANVLERKYAYPERVTAAAIGEAVEFRKAFPKVAFRQIEPNKPLPFADKSFDIATSNAVIEHVGSYEDQAFHIAELSRVARKVFITAPNRFFPIEHHTAIPLAHFWRPTFELACRALGKAEWLDPDILILVDRARLARMAPQAQTGYAGLPLGPFSSNLYLYIDQTA